MTLKIGISAVPVSRDGIDYVVQAERLGVDSVWVPEYWGYDALTPLAAVAVATDTIRLGTAIVQLGARTPAMLAMSAMAIQQISEGRFMLGVGTSGPQVMEGWHGVEFSRPLQRTRETIEIVRLVAAGERLEYAGEIYSLPIPGSQGKAIRAAAAPTEIPIYVASLGPANLMLTGEMADGWVGNSFLPEHADVFFEPIRRGAASSGRSLDELDLTVSVSVEFTDDVEEAGRRHAAGYAFTFGAMGSASTNFYNNAFSRQGFSEVISKVQSLWQRGDRDAARAAVPTEIGLRTNLIGPSSAILDRLRVYKQCGVTTLRVGQISEGDTRCLDGLGLLIDLVREVNAESPDQSN